MYSQKIISHIFNGWDKIPNLDHLKKIEDSYIGAAAGDIIYVSYIIENDKVMAFGSASYYKEENTFGDDCDESDPTGALNNLRKLWIEGMVSIKKGCGSIILGELEKMLINSAELHKVSQKIINVMSVSKSVGFYENNGYVECSTGPRFAGTDNVRMAKPILDFSMELADVRTNYSPVTDWLFSDIMNGRRKVLERYLYIPADIHHSEFRSFVLKNYTKGIFKSDISQDTITQLIEFLIEGCCW
jgi:hypothetical protein